MLVAFPRCAGTTNSVLKTARKYSQERCTTPSGRMSA